MAARMQPVLDGIMEMLKEGPITSYDVSLELGISRRNAAARMSDLYQRGIVDRKQIEVSRIEYLYSLITKGEG